MQKFNTTNVALNSIRLATPSVKVAGGEDRSLRSFEKFCEEKSQNVPVLRCSSCSVLFKHGSSQKKRVGVENHTITTPLHCSYT